MKYQRLSNEELRKFKYPNLMAELIESGYGICTCADHMGLGRREENDPEVWRKLRGDEELCASEAFGLSRLFAVNLDYLLSDELKTSSGMTYAFCRWSDYNAKRDKEYQEYLTRQEIERELRKKPYLLEFIREATSWTEEEVKEAIAKLKTA